MAAGVFGFRPPGRIERATSTRLRILCMLGVALILSGVVWSRLAYWQVLRHAQLSEIGRASCRERV